MISSKLRSTNTKQTSRLVNSRAGIDKRSVGIEAREKKKEEKRKKRVDTPCEWLMATLLLKIEVIRVDAYLSSSSHPFPIPVRFGVSLSLLKVRYSEVSLRALGLRLRFMSFSGVVECIRPTSYLRSGSNRRLLTNT